MEERPLVILHAMSEGGSSFLPCAYGYATTIRKAQGATLPGVVLYVDHCHPPERGYGYVAASRATSSSGLFLDGRPRRTDWLPVGEGSDEEQLHRGDDSDYGDAESEDEPDSEASEDEGLCARYARGDYGGGQDLEEAGLDYGDEEDADDLEDADSDYGDAEDDVPDDEEHPFRATPRGFYSPAVKGPAPGPLVTPTAARGLR